MQSRDFIEVDYPEPHASRTKAILRAHPEIKSLFGNVPSTAFYVYALVAFQLWVASRADGLKWWAFLLVVYFVGAVINHALFVLVHECAHNLIYRTSFANKVLSMIANIPLFFPSAISFRKYHLLHHRYQGDLERDGDLPGPWEARLVGTSTPKKFIWLLFFTVIEGLRPMRLRRVKMWDKWTVINLVFQAACLAAVVYFLGWFALFYLYLSTFFAVGLHPLGARWIQEHYVFSGKQETYSYYGPANYLCFDVGHHNEHHDFMRIPWMNLKQARAMAPEFYNTLHYHRSWTALLFRFLFDSKVSVYDRVIRKSEVAESAAPSLEAWPVQGAAVEATLASASPGLNPQRS